MLSIYYRKKIMSSTLDFDDRINDLIIKYLTDDISPEEMEFLRLWVHESLENKELFNNLKNSWYLANQNPGSIDFDSQKSISNLDATIFGNTPKGIIPSISFFFRKYAAIGLLFLALGGVISWSIKPSYQIYSNLSTIINAPLGAKSVVNLPDGTHVWLNAGSTIEYDPDFGKDTRTVRLTGEAFFAVAKDKARPFFVKTEQMVVKALGTRFNVKAYPEEKTITTTLEEGKIEVETSVNGSKSRHSQKILLKPKEKIVYFKQNETLDKGSKVSKIAKEKTENLKSAASVVLTKNVNTALYTSWKDERWILESEPLGSLGTIMERRFHIVIVFDQEELKNYKFTGSIENEPLDQILNAFKLTAPIDYKINKDTVFFTLDKNLREKYSKIIKY